MSVASIFADVHAEATSQSYWNGVLGPRLGVFTGGTLTDLASWETNMSSATGVQIGPGHGSDFWRIYKQIDDPDLLNALDSSTAVWKSISMGYQLVYSIHSFTHDTYAVDGSGVCQNKDPNSSYHKPIRWSDVASGAYDSYLDTFFGNLKGAIDDARTHLPSGFPPSPVLFSFHHEPENEKNGTPWQGGDTGYISGTTKCGPKSDFAPAARHVKDRALAAGLSNTGPTPYLLFMLDLTQGTWGSGGIGDYTNWKDSGSVHIAPDVFAVDGYNQYPKNPSDPNLSWQNLYSGCHDAAAAKGVYMFIQESGKDNGGGQAPWIKTARDALDKNSSDGSLYSWVNPNKSPHLIGYEYSHIDRSSAGNGDYTFTSSSQARWAEWAQIDGWHV